MALRSVYQIDINDSAFQKFASQFREYQAILATTPRTWAEATKAMDGSITSYKELVELAKARLLQAKMIGAAEKAASDQIEGPERRREEAAKRQAQAWKDMAKSARGFAAGVAGATTSLLRWGELTGLISGILGAGGLFGIDRLAASAFTERRSALGRNISIGEQASARINLSPLVDPDALLSGVNEALTDPRKTTPFYTLKLDPDEERKKGTFGASLDVLQAVKRLADATPAKMAGSTYDSRQIRDFGISFEDFERISNHSVSEIENLIKQAQFDKWQLNLTHDQQDAWDNLKLQLNRSGEEIEKVFIVGLTPLAPRLKDLSASFEGLVADFFKSKEVGEGIEKLGQGIKWFDGEIKNGDFNEAFTKFTENIGALGKAALNAAEYLAKLVGNNPSTTAAIAGTGVGAEVGSVAGGIIGGLAGVFGGPAGIVAGVAGGSTIGAGVGAVVGGFGADLTEQARKAAAKSGKRADQAHDFFRSQGWTEAQTDGILANLSAESGFNPKAYLAGTGRFGAALGSHVGIAQWDHTRQQEFEKLFGHSLLQGTYEEQLAFVQYELTHSEKKAGERLKQLGSTSAESADIINKSYERSGTNSAYRSAVANQYAQQYKDRSVTVSVHNNTGGNANVSVLQNGPAS